MAEDIGDLIEKIKQEGINAAEEQAQKIESAARQEAEAILAQARLEAEKIVAAARENIRLEDEKARALLAQAGRDFLLSLRSEINAMLERIVVADIQHALAPEALAGLIVEIVKNYKPGGEGDITIILKPEDLDLLEKHFLGKLGEAAKSGIVLKPSGEISGGFLISFDRGRSAYDFTDQGLAEYIGGYLKPKLNGILQEAIQK